MIKSKGHNKVEKDKRDEQLFHTRLICYFTILPHLDPKKRKPEITEMFPWFEEDKKNKGSKAIGKRVRDMNPEELAEWQASMKAHLANMANPENN